jgi:hypothetical protein
MVQGVANSAADPIFANLRAVLEGVAECAPGSARPMANAFPLSASVVRTADRSVDITINPILINGQVVGNLNESNFEVIENGCGKRIAVTTSMRAVDVDITFIQDFSGSMGNAITGVRNSVLAFASDLQNRGVNVRLASVGFSGSGSIPTSPATSSCEFLGPAQDFTDPAAFRAHVATSWVTRSGCDTPENGLEAIEYAQERLSWRPGAARVYILITDSSLHTKLTSCNGRGACTDHDLASITALIGSSATMHVVAHASATSRTAGRGLDPWTLADAVGGKKLTLGAGGTVDLIGLNISSVIGQVARLSYQSTSNERATHDIRIRVSIPGIGVSEIAPGLTLYRGSTPPATARP